MFRFLNAFVFLLLTSLAFAQGGQKTVTGYLIDANDMQYVRALTGPTASADQLTSARRFDFPRWDGKDANGNFIGYNRLRKVRFETTLQLDVRIWGENTLAQASTWWQAAAGVATYWTMHPSYLDDPSLEPLGFGGSRPVMWADGSESTPAFDGVTDGAGASGHYVYLQGQPTFWEDVWVSNALLRELRAWSGPTGSMATRYLNVRSRTEDHFPSHWPSWGDTGFNVRDFFGQPGTKLQVTYFYDTAPTPPVIVTHHPWTDIAMRVVDSTAPAETLMLPGYTGDPTKLVDAIFETRFDYWSNFGLENMGQTPAICGGGALEGMRVLGPSGEYLSAMGYQAGVGSNNTPVTAFDGTCDFEGTSGVTRHAGSNWDSYDSFRLSEHPGYPSSQYLGQTFAATVDTPWSWIAFTSLTGGVPDSAFQWWYRGTIQGRTRPTYFHTP